MRMYVGRRIYGRNYAGVSFPIKANYIVAWILGNVIGFVIVAITFASCIAIHNSPSAIEERKRERERERLDINNYYIVENEWVKKDKCGVYKIEKGYDMFTIHGANRVGAAEAWEIIKHNHLEDKYPGFNIEK